jgi:hypothetical protein
MADTTSADHRSDPHVHHRRLNLACEASSQGRSDFVG